MHFCAGAVTGKQSVSNESGGGHKQSVSNESGCGHKQSVSNESGGGHKQSVSNESGGGPAAAVDVDGLDMLLKASNVGNAMDDKKHSVLLKKAGVLTCPVLHF